MPKKPISYCLEMKYKVIQNGVCFTKESMYGIYSCVSKARKDIEEMRVLQMTDNVVLGDNIEIIKGENYYE